MDVGDEKKDFPVIEREVNDADLLDRKQPEKSDFLLITEN